VEVGGPKQTMGREKNKTQYMPMWKSPDSKNNFPNMQKYHEYIQMILSGYSFANIDK